MLRSFTCSKESPLNYDSASTYELESPKYDDKTKKHRILITDIEEPLFQAQKYSLPAQLTAVKNQRKQISVDNSETFSALQGIIFCI